MDPGNFDPFDPLDPSWLQAYTAMLQQVEPAEQEQLGQIGQEEFERHLAEERQGGAASIAAGPARSDPRYPHLSDNDQSLITSAVAAEVERGHLTELTGHSYAGTLRRLGNHLGERGQTIGALDYDSLLAHAREFFPSHPHVVPGLKALRRHRERGHEGFERHLADARQGSAVSVAGAPTRSDSQYRYLSMTDRDLINSTLEAAVGRGDLKESTSYVYALALRNLGNHLGERGQTIDALDHESLLEYAKECLPLEQRLISALNALQRYREIDQVGHEDLERHLADGRQGRAASVAGTATRSDSQYAYLSIADRNLINSAFEAEVTRADLKKGTRGIYASALRRLGNHLGERGQSIDALDHESLVAHAKKFLSSEPNVLVALKALRRYREPGIPDRKRRRVDVSAEDAILIDRALQAAAARWGWIAETSRKYERVLRSLAESLGPDQTMTSLDHDSLVAHANKSLPNTRFLRPALNALREYRVSNALADRGPSDQHSSFAEAGDVVDDRIRSNERTENTSQTPLNTMRDSHNSSLMEGTPSAVSSWQMAEQAARSSLQDVDLDKIWQEGDQSGQLPADSWDTSNFWEGLPSPSRLPQQSSSPAAANPAWPPRNDFGYALPLQFNHGPQGAPDGLIGELNRIGLLPGRFQPSINLYLHGQPYTATLGPGFREATPNNPHGEDIVLMPRLVGG